MYRFDTFHDELCLELLENVHTKTFHQAYIFEGPEGLNILESAKLFATALTCERRSTAPCGECDACKLSYAGTNPDIVFIDSGDKKSIGVDAIRNIQKDIYVRPFKSENKVYIITDGTLLTAEAQNAMLKILEEPPEYVVFIIIATTASALLQTISSRAVKLRFMPLSEDAMRRYLREKHPGSGNHEFLIRFSEGIPKRCDDILSDENFEPLRLEASKMLIPLLSKHKISAFKVAEFVEANKDKVGTILNLWQSFLRDIFLMQNGAPELTANPDLKDELSKLASMLPEKYVSNAINRIIIAKNMNRRQVNLHALVLNLSFSIKKGSKSK